MTSISKLIARKFVFPVVVGTGLNKLIVNKSRYHYLILNYHGVVKSPDFSVSVNHMSITDFESQIRYFSKNFTILNQKDFISHIQSETIPDKKCILITFDDGYENNYLNAFPVLKKYNAPASIFPVTGLTGTSFTSWYDTIDLTKHELGSPTKINALANLSREFGFDFHELDDLGPLTTYMKKMNPETKKRFLDKYLSITNRDAFTDPERTTFWKMMTKEQIREMSDSGLITFGSHTINHPNLDMIDAVEVRQELTESKIFLENITQKEIDSVAFPDGAYNDDVKAIARNLGYKIMFSVTPRCDSDNIEKDIFRRFSVPNTTTSDSVIFNASKAFGTQGVGPIS